MGFVKRIFEFISHPTQSRTMGLVVVLVLLAAIPLTVYVAQQQQNLRQQAANPACSPGTYETIPTCSSNSPSGSSCSSENATCRVGNAVYKCD